MLDDADPEQRKLGMDAGFAWRAMAEATVVYTDLGVSRGMLEGLLHAQKLVVSGDHAIEYRELGGW